MNTTYPSSALAAAPRVALIAGPTASGKSAAALALAEREGGTIINADASQVYAELRLLSARPSRAEEARVPHRLFGYRAGDEPCSAAAWAEDAKTAIAATLAEGRLPILVGGTGLYFRVLLDGIAPVPAIDPAVRDAVRALDAGAAAAALAIEDPAMAARLHANDRARLQRALEVIRSTGRSLGDWQQDRAGGIAGRYRFDVSLFDPPVADLYARCDARFVAMVAAGALDEVARLLARDLPARAPVMTAIGVPPLIRHLRGEIALDAAIGEAQQATRNYAKRQRTWFRHQPLVEQG